MRGKIHINTGKENRRQASGLTFGGVSPLHCNETLASGQAMPDEACGVLRLTSHAHSTDGRKKLGGHVYRRIYSTQIKDFSPLHECFVTGQHR